MAAADPLAIGERADFKQALAALNVALDHPIERTAVDQLGPARRHHARGVELLRRLPGTAALLEPEGDPFFEVFDAVAADAEL